MDAKALAEARVIEVGGRERALGEAWETSDALVVLVRHFACAGCAEHLAELRPRLAELAALGVSVTIVGSGTAPQLEAFVEREGLAGLPLACVTDPGLGAYRAAGLARSRWGVYGPRALAYLAGAWSRGVSNGAAEGDHLQQGGTVYIAKGGEVLLAHAAEYLGDHAKVADVMDVALARRAVEAAV